MIFIVEGIAAVSYV